MEQINPPPRLRTLQRIIPPANHRDPGASPWYDDGDAMWHMTNKNTRLDVHLTLLGKVNAGAWPHCMRVRGTVAIVCFVCESVGEDGALLWKTCGCDFKISLCLLHDDSGRPARSSAHLRKRTLAVCFQTLCCAYGYTQTVLIMVVFVSSDKTRIVLIQWLAP